MANASLFRRLAPAPFGRAGHDGGGFFMDENLRKQSGRKDLTPTQRREHCVSVRLNDAELERLDIARGRHQRGEALRMISMDKLPAPVPEINVALRADLGRSLGNLATIATAMRAGNFAELGEIKILISELRNQLLGATK